MALTFRSYLAAFSFVSLIHGAASLAPAHAESCGPNGGFVKAADVARHFTASLEVTDMAGRKSDAAGFFISADGTFLTAAHALSAGASITVLMPDHGRLSARLLASDPLSDIAVLKVSGAHIDAPGHFRAAPLALGEPVAAIGSPLGYQHSLTAGIVSALDRAYGPTTPYDFVQHDAALNPGSSGGPLLDKDGEIVGMNVAIADGARRNVGVSLAVPAVLVARIAARLIEEGHIARPTLGLQLRDGAAMQDAIPELAQGGLLVEQVQPQSPAELAGLKPGDVLLQAEGKSIATSRDLARIIEPLAPGNSLALVVLRAGARVSVTLALGQQTAEAAPRLTRSLKFVTPNLGLTLDHASARIETVEPGSAAARAGLAHGDVLLAIGLKPVTSAEQANALLAQGGASKALLVQRGASSRYIVLGSEGRIDSANGFGANIEAGNSTSL